MSGILMTLALVCIVLFIIYQGRTKELDDVDTVVNIDDMPTLKPVPIAVLNQDGFLNKLLMFIFIVRHWRVEKAFVYEYNGTRYAIPAGFIFDGASIPKCLWMILSPVGLLLVPGLIHDFGYRYNGIYILNDENQPVWDNTICTQEGWDKLFREIGNKVNQLPLLNALAEFGLLIGGAKAWDDWRDRKEPQPVYLNTLDNTITDPIADTINSTIDDTKNEPAVKQSVEESSEYESGTTKTTQIGYVNANNQKVLGSKNLDAADKKNVSYKMACEHCGEVYGSSTASVFRRKCPACQEGKPSVEY